MTKAPIPSNRGLVHCLNQCAPEGTRTPNLLIRSQMLYPLSYGRMLLARAHNVVQNTSRQAGARIETGVIGTGVEGAQLALQRDPAV